MARLKQPGCCECGGVANCEVRILNASKNRNGFPVLYITAAVTGGVKRSKLRYFTKTMDYTSVDHINSVNNRDYYAEISIVERLNGKVAYSESSSGSVASIRAGAVATINTIFNDNKDLGNGTHFTSSVLGIFTTETTDTVNFTYEITEGVDIVTAEIERHVVVYYTSDPGDITEDYTITFTVALDDEYDDTTFKADVDDLLTAQNTGLGVGLNGVADRTLCAIAWNENGINYAIGNGTTGASDPTKCAIDPTSLSGYTTTPGPSIVADHYTPLELFTIYGIDFWQHPGGGSSNGEPDGESYTVYNCEFEEDATMPRFLVAAVEADWSRESCHRIRFNVAGDVCCTYSRIDNAGTTDAVCIVATSSGGHADFYEPHPDTISNSNIRRIDHASWWEFTSPGALTAGGCPCTGAP